MPNGEKRMVQYAIVDLDEITASHNEETFSSSAGYPVNAAGRNINDRNYQDDPAAQRNVLEIAQHLEPERLIELSSKPAGTPIINPDGFVISGNNRVMSLKLAVKRFPGNYRNYREYLLNDIDVFGFMDSVEMGLRLNKPIPLPGSSYSEPKAAVFRHPVLVRVDSEIPTLTTTELAKYNLDTKKGERPVDQLVKLSNILKENTRCRDTVVSIVDGYETFSEFFGAGPQANQDRKKLLQAFIDCGLIPQAKTPEYYNDGLFTDAGKDFVENILASIILEPDALKVANADGVKRFRQIIVTSLPVLIANENLPEGSLKDYISQAVVIQYKVQQVGDFSDYIASQDLFETKRMDAKAFYLNRLLDAGRNTFKAQIIRYNEAVKSNAGAGLFETEKLAIDQIFDRTVIAALSAKEISLIRKKFGAMDAETGKPDIIEETTAPAIKNIADNASMFYGNNFFQRFPDKVLGVAYKTSGRFGPVTKYKGDITALSRIEVDMNFIGNEKDLIDPLLSTDDVINLTVATIDPATENFIKQVNQESEETVKNIVVKRQRKKSVVNDDATVTPEIPELLTFEQIYEKYNPEISAEELEVFLWYKTDIGKPLSSRWARLVDKIIYDHPLSTPYPFTVVEEKKESWIKKGLIFYYAGKFLPAFLYLSGDVYQRSHELELDKEHIISSYGQDVFNEQKTRLATAFQEKYEKRLIISGANNDAALVILPTSKFATKFKIDRLQVMPADGEFKIAVSKGLPDWVKEAGASEKTKRETFKTLNLKDAFAYYLLFNRPALLEELSHLEIIKHYLNNSPIRSKLPQNSTKADEAKEQAQVAKLKASLQKEAERLFKDFLNSELTETDKLRLENEWNAKYNNYLPINYNKVPVAFTMAKYYNGKPEELRPEKREAVAQALTNGTLCLAFDVGVGKTPSSIFVISAFIDAGYCKRPYICVPNQVYKQFISEIKGFAPHIPVIEAYNLSESYIENLKNASGDIAEVPAGCITVMTYEGLEQIGFNDATYDELNDELYQILNQGGESERQKTQKQREGFQERLATILGKGLRGGLYNIEDFGFDFACYDEAHKLKKVFTAVKGEVEIDDKGNKTREKNPYVINSGNPSSIGLKSFMLNQYILKRNGYQNILLLTATPFTNSPLEIFSMLSMLAYEQLQNTDLNNIKNFFDTYVKTSTELVINAKLKPEFKQVIVGFNNLISLQTLIRRFINYKTGEDVNVIRPNKYILPYLKKEINGTVVELDEHERVETYIQMTPQQAAMMNDIISYVEGKIKLHELGAPVGVKQSAIQGEDEDDTDVSEGEEVNEEYLSSGEKAGVRMLRGMNYASNLALSPFLYENSGLGTPTYRSYIETSPKLLYVMGCIRTVKAYHEAKDEPISGQVIYMDRGIQYFELIKEYLVEEIGFKPHEIGIIRSGLPAGIKKNSKEFVKNLFNGQIYNESTKLFDHIPDEDRIKIIIGSSSIKEGMNLQKYATGLYDCWLDWNPTDFVQLGGRIWRQGNTYLNVRIVVPLMVNSMDVFIFQKLQEKTSRLNTIWATDGKSNVLRLDEFNPEELKYALIRDPKVIADLQIIEDETKIDSERLGIERLKDRVEHIKDHIAIINASFEDAVSLVKDYRSFSSTNNKSRDAQRIADLILDVLRTQLDKEGRPMVDIYRREQGEKAPKYSPLESLDKPYWFNDFYTASHALAREIREFLAPAGIKVSFESNIVLERFADVQQKKLVALDEKKKKLRDPENMARITKEIEEERAAKKISYKGLSDVVNDFAKLNYLLSERKINLLPEQPMFTGCPPMENGERVITDEALQYMEACILREPDTKSQNIDNVGQYTPERDRIHDNIITREFKNVRCIKQAKPIAVFTGGSPGSGKSTFLKKHAQYLLSPEVFHLDADEIRAALPEYKGWNANATHRESQDIVNKLLSVIGEGKCRYDFIYDGTMNKAQKYFSLINRVKAMGYETYILFMVIPYGIARNRILQRYKKTGRFVPIAVLDEFFQKLPSGKTRGEDALDQLKPVVDGYMIVDGVSGDIMEQGGKELPETRNYDGFFKATKAGTPSKAEPSPTTQQPARSSKKSVKNQIEALKVSVKYLPAARRERIREMINSLKISIKYL